MCSNFLFIFINLAKVSLLCTVFKKVPINFYRICDVKAGVIMSVFTRVGDSSGMAAF